MGRGGGLKFESLERWGCEGEKVRVARGVGAADKEGEEGMWWMVAVCIDGVVGEAGEEARAVGRGERRGMRRTEWGNGKCIVVLVR